MLIQIIEDDRQTNLVNINKNFENLKLKENYNTEQKFITYLILGYKNLNYIEKNRVESFEYFLKALNITKKEKDNSLKKFTLYSLLNFYLKAVLQGNKNFNTHLSEYKKLCKTTPDWLYYYHFKFNLLAQTKTYINKDAFSSKLYSNLFKQYDSTFNSTKNLNVIGFLYFKDKANFIIRKNPLLAKEFYNKSSSLFKESDFYKFQKFNNLINLSRVASSLKNHVEGLIYLNKAKKFISYNDSLLDLYDISAHKANHFNHLKKYDSAYYHEKNVRFLNYKINFQKENQNVSEFRTKLKAQENENENIQLKADKIQNRNLLIASLISFILVSFIGILILKNSKRKRKLAEQDKEIETQKNLTLLKEQEITTINAMVNGQEKERKQIAEDLHDNLGSVLATLKLHFDNLKINREKKKINQEELFNKTESLIDEAYLKVRSIAHAKNSGVIANQGLLTAVKMMAEKISSADKIKIDVIDFGLYNRLENSLELTIFRIIQELTTNVLKHADAKNITINISQFKENLNIIIEDDGIGFNVDKIDSKNGMGLNSIKTRIKHLKGNFKIDSTLKKGTSIIINIPVE